ncbi:MAG: hypothetical protein HJJLKODD_00896 [Phycisphaerae bacterium]|nr:hypothetical protein [Phycisphaerae bacterium]
MNSSFRTTSRIGLRQTYKRRHVCTSAFTLVELVIVIVIMAILAAIAIPKFSTATEKSKLQQTISSAVAIDKALQLWVADMKIPYPAVGVPRSTEINILNNIGTSPLYKSDLHPYYMSKIPMNQYPDPPGLSILGIEAESSTVHLPSMGGAQGWIVKYGPDQDRRMGWIVKKRLPKIDYYLLNDPVLYAIFLQ